jgi:hypothetical protein
MRLWVRISVVLLAMTAPFAFGQSDCGTTPTTGGPLQLALPIQHCQNWWVPLNSNMSAINTFAGQTVIYSPPGSQTITQPVNTRFNTNSLLLVNASLEFGYSPDTPVSWLSLTTPGNFTLDVTSPGTGDANLSVNQINGNTASMALGFQINGTAPLNHIMLGNGVRYVDSATIPSSALPALYYQTVAGQPQQPQLQFSSRFALSNTPPSTTIDLAATGVTAGTYTYPSSISVDTFGRVTALSSGSAVGRTCNAAGCYKIDADGTITEWFNGSYSASAYSGTNVTVSFPYPMPNSVDGFSVSTSTNAGGDLAEAAVFTVSSYTTSNITVFNVHNADHGGNSIAPFFIVYGH